MYENILHLHYRKKKKIRIKIVSNVFVEMKKIFIGIILFVPRDSIYSCGLLFIL